VVGPGVFIAATDRGNVALLAFDATGRADERDVILPTSDLRKACHPLKTAKRILEIHGDRGVVITERKGKDQRAEVTIHRGAGEFPPLAEVMQRVCSVWAKDPGKSETAGRYDLAYLGKVIKSIEARQTSVVLSAFDGGPLRAQADDGSICALVMPQTKEPIPGLPQFLADYAAG